MDNKKKISVTGSIPIEIKERIDFALTRPRPQVFTLSKSKYIGNLIILGLNAIGLLDDLEIKNQIDGICVFTQEYSNKEK